MANQEMLEKLQSVILMMALDFDSFCKEHEITYYMMGGTALGAIRHQGFIPWDDDFDVFMERAEYLKFIAKANEDFPNEKYSFQQENTEDWPLYFSKIRLNGTRYTEKHNTGKSKSGGIYIDIMCLHPAAENKWRRKVQYFSARTMSAFALDRRGFTANTTAKKMAMLLSRILSIPPVHDFLARIARGESLEKTSLVGHFFGRAPFKATTFPKKYLGMQRFVPFDSAELPVPEMVEKYLEVRYGKSYMDMPSQDVIDSFPSHLESCDFGKWA